MTDIKNPETSQAFYGELAGAPQTFRIISGTDFRLYIGILVPDVPNVKKDISAEIDRVTPSGTEQIATLDGNNFDWTPFYEEFGKDNYFWGPEFKADDSKKGGPIKGLTVPAGTYIIKISSPDNAGKYSMAIGDIESFPASEMINAALLLPYLKSQFFGDSAISILSSPFGWGYILALYLFAFIFGSVFRFLIRKFANKNPLANNIGPARRIVRAGIGAALLALALATSWNPLIIFLSGFLIFEAIFG